MRGLNKLDLVEIKEGGTRLLVPDPKKYLREDGVFEPAWAPVFYNPVMSFCRDIVVLFVKSYFTGRDAYVADPLAGTGARGIRIANEVGENVKVYLNDIDPVAVALCEKNAALNGVEDRVVIENYDANLALRLHAFIGEKFDLIDIDPFGSPIPFIESAASALKIKGVLALTATDTANLSGTFPKACYRRYWAWPLREGPFKEVAVRILIGAVVRKLASLDYAVKPIVAYHVDHYVRVYMVLDKGARKALKALSELGYVEFNPRTGEFRLIDDPCEAKHGNIVRGPLYKGSILDQEVLKAMLGYVGEMKLACLKRALWLLSMLIDESSMPPLYYSLDDICSRNKLNMPKVSLVIEALRERGYRASRTHMDNRGIKCDAPFNELLDVVRALSLKSS